MDTLKQEQENVDNTSSGEPANDSRPKGAESSGDIRGGGHWQVFATAEGFAVVVTYAPGARVKRRVPKTLTTLERRASYAAGAAPGIKAKAIAGKKAPEPAKPDPTKLTFADVGMLWTSGELTKRFPDHVPAKSSADADKSRLDHLNKWIGHVAIESFSLDDAERAMSNLPATCKTPATRKQYGQVIRRVLAMSVYPLRLRADNPIPKGFMPKTDSELAMQWVYPSEEARVATCTTIPLARRLLWGVLAREGMRNVSEATALTWECLDLDDKGTLRLDKNKTSFPRMWKLDPSVRRALLRWRHLRFPNGKAPPKGSVLVDESGHSWGEARLADLFREDLRTAGVKRPELYEKVPGVRNPVRAYDLRASFVTVKLSIGWTEDQVKRRTGHKTSAMLARYRRVAGTAEEIEVGDFLPLDELLFGEVEGPPEPDEGKRSGPVPPPATTPTRGREGASSSMPSGSARGDAEDDAPPIEGTQTLNPLVSGSSPGWPTFLNDINDIAESNSASSAFPTPRNGDVSGVREPRRAGTGDAGTGSGTAVDPEQVTELRRVAFAALGMLDLGDVESAREELRAFLRRHPR